MLVVGFVIQYRKKKVWIAAGAPTAAD
jgi:hypothetical protein